MGVNYLWSLLKPVKHEEHIDCMRGKLLAVDLSMWICQALETQGLQAAVKKPHLRNLFYRVLCLQNQGIHLLFVTDGEPPELKHAKVLQRLQERGHCIKTVNHVANNMKNKYKGRKGGRFDQLTKECCLMLECLGIPVIRSDGEAEATCARLNQMGIVDGCITNDSDAFLFGAKVVYRHLRTTSKDQFVMRYEMDEISNDLGLNQTDLIAIALLLGCDYCDGVSGIGKETVRKLIKESKGVDLLKKFQSWRKTNFVVNNTSAVEKTLLRKLKGIKEFPNIEVAMEFLCPLGAVSINEKKMPQRTYPKIASLKAFCFDYLEWPGEYTLEKTLPLITRQYITRLSEGKDPKTSIKPIRIESICKRNHVPMYGIEWHLDKNTQTLLELDLESFSTLEPRIDIVMNFPGLPMTEKVQKKISSKNKIIAKQQLKYNNKTQEKNDEINGQTSEEKTISELSENLKVSKAHNNSITAERIVEKVVVSDHSINKPQEKKSLSSVLENKENLLVFCNEFSKMSTIEKATELRGTCLPAIKPEQEDIENVTMPLKETDFAPVTELQNVSELTPSDTHVYLPLMVRMQQRKMKARLK